MTPAQLTALAACARTSLEVRAHAVGLEHHDLPALAERLSLPWKAYACRPQHPGVTAAEDDGIECRLGSFSLALARAEDGDSRHTLDRLRNACRLLVPGGVLVLDIHPRDVTPAMAGYLTAHYDPIYADGSIVLGRRKPAPDVRTATGRLPRGSLPTLSMPLPPSPGPGETWKKVRATQEEIVAFLASQEVQEALAFRPPPERPGLRPLLPLSDGHLVQAMGTGLLDGPITMADGRRAVLRGFAGKTAYEKSKKPLHSNGPLGDNGSVTVWGERPHLWVRIVDHEGRFETLAATTESP